MFKGGLFVATLILGDSRCKYWPSPKRVEIVDIFLGPETPLTETRRLSH